TLDQYERDVAKMALLFPTFKLRQFTDVEVLRTLRTWPAPSRYPRSKALGSFFTWAVLTRRISKNPMHLVPKIKKRKRPHFEPFGQTSFTRWWGNCLDLAGVRRNAKPRERNPHIARHTFATEWLRRGGRLEVLSGELGHESIKTTFDLYAHLDTRDVLVDLAVIGENRPERNA